LETVSQENVEIMRAYFAAWNAGDMDALRDLHAADVVSRLLEGWPEPGPFVGRDAVMRQIEGMRETWGSDALEAIGGFIDAGDRVVVRFIWSGAGQGPEANFEVTGVYTMRKGKISYQEFFWGHSEALEVMGLSEEDARARSS
jgi:ketosteroid isomerase-like protein